MQLGAGCSITAIDNGLPRDTSMGFSPLEGLVMATRSGDIDPGLITYLQRQEGLTTEQLDRLLNEQSGLLGVSGMSGDMRELLDSRMSNRGWRWICIAIGHVNIWALISRYWAAPTPSFLAGEWARMCRQCAKRF